MKVVINVCYGGFSLSKRAAEFMAERGDEAARREIADWTRRNAALQHFRASGNWPDTIDEFERSLLEIDAQYGDEADFDFPFDGERHSVSLVAAVESLGEAADGRSAGLKIVEIPDGVEYVIQECEGGMEHIAEKHRTWA